MQMYSLAIMAKRSLTPEELAAADRIAEARKRSGKSQDVIAVEVGVNQTQISHWETAKLRVPPEKALALANALDVHPEEISPAWKEATGHQSGDRPIVFDSERWERLSPSERLQIEEAIELMMIGFEARGSGNKPHEEQHVGNPIREEKKRTRPQRKEVNK